MIWHLITSEYPPQAGGVSDYTHLVATGLAAASDEVHVWCPPAQGETPPASGVFVHRELGHFTPADLRRIGFLLNQFDAPRKLLVQWVPHGYGYQAMNLPFCIWLWWRTIRHRDRVELMVHEPFLSFREGSWRQNIVAVMHRLMTIILLHAASRVWMTIPAWEGHLRPYAFGRRMSFTWLPVTSNIPVVPDAAGVDAIRSRYAGAEGSIVGHFGTYDRPVTKLLLSSVPALLQNGNKASALLLGRGSEAMREQLIRPHPEIADRVHATGELDAADLSLHLRACDVLLQPYIDGVSSRRTSVMVALAHGVPIVTTKGELTEPLWADSGAVSLASVADMTAFVNETRLLLADEKRRLRLSVAARALYQDRFHLDHTIAALRESACEPSSPLIPKLMRKPDFFIVGAPRCGTTAMNTYLRQHPEIFMAAVKESHFFAPDFQPPNARFKNEKDYLTLFSDAGDEKVLGESSVGYLFSNVAAVRIKEFNPEAKIIIMLRNPVEMVYSHHSRLLVEGFEEIKDFEAAVAAEGARKHGLRWPTGRYVPRPALFYTELGKFSRHVTRFLDLFGRRNVHVIIFDEFKRDTARIYRETCEFLGVDPVFQPNLRVLNSNRCVRSQSLSRYLRNLRNPQRNLFYQVKYLVPQTWRRSIVEKLWSFNVKEQTRPAMSPELRNQLSAEFAPDVLRLSEMLGFDLTHWSRS